MILKVFWCGAACVIVKLNRQSLLFDPYFENIKISPEVTSMLSDIKSIFITHGHFDHIAVNQGLLENSNAPIYLPEHVNMNMIRWAYKKDKSESYKPFNIKTKNISYAIDELEKRFRFVKAGDLISEESLKVTTLDSNHVNYDPAIFRDKLSSFSNLKYIPGAIKLAKHYKKHEVFGYRAEIMGKSIINFGSMPERITDDIINASDADVLFVPMAGKKSKNLVKPALRLIEAVKPKIVIPHHHNDFFPPISDQTEIDRLKSSLKELFPEIKFIEPVLGESIEIEFQD